jgi:hypothetical protein
LGTRSAAASECSGIYSPCINAEALWPHGGPARFLAIGSAETIAAGQIAFALATSYQSRPVTITVPAPAPPGTRQYAIDDQVNGTFVFSYGVSNRLELDLALPVTFGQGGTGLAPVTGGLGLKDTAVRDVRFGFAYAALPHLRLSADAPASDGLGLVARFEVSAPAGDRDQLAGERSGVFVPTLSAEYRHGRIFAGAEAGARIRPTTELLGARVGTQLVTALGVGYDILPRDLLAAALEAWALPGFDEQHDIQTPAPDVTRSVPNGKLIAPAEWQLSLRTVPLRGGDLSIQAGGGGAIPLSGDTPITTPRFRFTLAVRWAPLARRVEGAPVATPAAQAAPAVDLRLASATDPCRGAPDLVDGFKDDDGCPDEDQDKDGIPNRLDSCPLLPEDFAGLADGCPEKK